MTSADVEFDVTPGVTQDFTDNQNCCPGGAFIAAGGRNGIVRCNCTSSAGTSDEGAASGSARAAIILLSDGTITRAMLRAKRPSEMGAARGSVVYTSAPTSAAWKKSGDKIWSELLRDRGTSVLPIPDPRRGPMISRSFRTNFAASTRFLQAGGLHF